MDIECKKGGISYEEYLALIDRVFVDNPCPFEVLLPKLYKPWLKPQENTYFITVDGTPRGSVGIYPRTAVVGEERLKVAGIGNVSCEKEFEGKGFMRRMMTAAQKEMTDDGFDLSDLGGSRHRYAFYGYEAAGSELHFVLDETNMRRTGMEFTGLSFRPMIQDDVPMALKLYNSQPLHLVRTEMDFLDCARSWNRTPMTVLKDGKSVGYFIPDENRVREPFMTDESLYPSLFAALVAQNPKKCCIILSETRPVCQILYSLCDRVSLHRSENFLVLNYRNVISACLKLKSSMEALPEGSVDVLIHGYRADEHLKITVSGGIVTVENSTSVPEIELSHPEAQSVLFAPVDMKRKSLPQPLKGWLPLPMGIDETDHV